jgi:hypothetical protein
MKPILGIQFVAGLLSLEWLHKRYLFSVFKHYGEVNGPSLQSLLIIAFIIGFSVFLVFGAVTGLCGRRWGVYISCVCQLLACLAGCYYIFLSFKTLLPPAGSPFGLYFLLLSVPLFLLSLSGFIILLKHLLRTGSGAEKPSA